MNYVNNKLQDFYRDIELQPGDDKETEIEKKERELEGISKTNYEDIFTILEYHVNLDIEGFEDMGVDGLPTGIKLPYIVTLEERFKRNFINQKKLGSK
jgi:hypothetical protein